MLPNQSATQSDSAARRVGSSSKQQVRLILDNLYTDPSSPYSFRTPRLLYKAARDQGIKVTKKDVKDYLREQESFTRFKSKRKFSRRPIVAFKRDALWQSDLATVDNIARYNEGINYILTSVDTLSDSKWFEPVKRKSGQMVTDAFQRLLTRLHPRRPKMLLTDKGLEFYNSTFQNFLEHENILHYSTTTNMKAAAAERANRSLKSKLYKYMIQNRSWKYLHALPDIEKALNNTINRTIGIPPSKVTPENEKEIFQKRYGKRLGRKKLKKPSFTLGETVRALDEKSAFQKESHPSLSKGFFRVVSITKTSPRMYKLNMIDANENDLGEVERAFYSPELKSAKVTTTPAFPNPPISKKYRPVI